MQKGEKLFKKSNKIQRLPENVRRAEKVEMEKMIRRWREEMGEIIKELKCMKNWKDKLRHMMEKVREEIRK